MKLNYITIPIITIAVSVLGSFLTSAGMDWYKTLKLPSIAPGGNIIGSVWTVIFILSTISALIVWNNIPKTNLFWWIIGLFIANAILNVLWSFIFFYSQSIGPSIIEMIILELTVLCLCILIWPFSKIASILLWPYAAWVIFATYLAYNIWILNK
ncbi:tryptophan-rich sensory protein [Candidatus Falkowbacteria bacterium]|nr:tryptophan-rich sensory protein [Candidatus Falkowbacteria bacterium]